MLHIELKVKYASDIYEELEDKIRDLLEAEGIPAVIEDDYTGNTTVTRTPEEIKDYEKEIEELEKDGAKKKKKKLTEEQKEKMQKGLWEKADRDFDKLVELLKDKPGVYDPEALAASIEKKMTGNWPSEKKESRIITKAEMAKVSLAGVERMEKDGIDAYVFTDESWDKLADYIDTTDTEVKDVKKKINKITVKYEEDMEAYSNLDNMTDDAVLLKTWQDAIESGDMIFVGIIATAEIYTSAGGGSWLINKIKSGGLWSIEYWLSGENIKYNTDLKEIEEEQVDNLKDVLMNLGFTAEEIPSDYTVVKEF